MTSAQVVKMSVKVTPNSPSQDYSHPDDHNLRTYDMTPGFKPFTILNFIAVDDIVINLDQTYYHLPKIIALHPYNH